MIEVLIYTSYFWWILSSSALPIDTLSDNVTCAIGSFGLDCSGVCHCQEGNDVCDPVTGMCSKGGCSRGFMGMPTCQTPCHFGLYGTNCAHSCNCPIGDSCDPINGICHSGKCRYGWNGASCQSRLPSLSLPPEVTGRTSTSVTVTWKSWVEGIDIGHGDVHSYLLEIKEGVTGRWMRAGKPYPADPHRALHSGFVQNLDPTEWYKFRVTIQFVEHTKLLVSVPGPETGFVSSSCLFPTEAPSITEVSLEKIYENNTVQIKAYWVPAKLSVENCASTTAYEVIIRCQLPCISQKTSVPENVFKASFWNISTGKSYNLVVRSVIGQDQAGPESKPSVIFVPNNPVPGVLTIVRGDNIQIHPKPDPTVEEDLNPKPVISKPQSEASIALHPTPAKKTDRERSPVLDKDDSTYNDPSLGLGWGVNTLTQWGKTISLIRGERFANLSWNNPIPVPQEYQVIIKGHYSYTEPLSPNYELKYTVSVTDIYITNLIPATLYSCSLVAVFASGHRQAANTTFWTLQLEPQKLATPPRITDSNENQIFISFKHVSISTGPLDGYEIVVQTSNFSENFYPTLMKEPPTKGISLTSVDSGGSAVTLNNSTLDYHGATQLGLNYYITAFIHAPLKPVSTIYFTIGDNKKYAQYLNKALEKGKKYAVRVSIRSTIDDVIKRSVSDPSETVILGLRQARRERVLEGLRIFGWIVLGLFVLGCFIVALYFLHKKLTYNRNMRVYTDVITYHHGLTLAEQYVNQGKPYDDRSSSTDYPLHTLDCSQKSMSRSILRNESNNNSGSMGDVDSTLSLQMLNSSSTTQLQRLAISEEKNEEYADFSIPVKDLMRLYHLVDIDIKDEFDALPSGFQHSVSVGHFVDNLVRNRTSELVPYDHNRISLTKFGRNKTSDYINASMVCLSKEHSYIVTQHPMRHTVGDFWKVVWEYNVNKIITLISSQEIQPPEFEIYWPQDKPAVFKHVTVSLLGEETFANFTLRTFRIISTQSEQVRRLTHFQYQSWNTYEIPHHVIPFLEFVNLTTQQKSTWKHRLVHCQGGSGRSGLYIAVAGLITEGRKKGAVDIVKAVTKLKSERVNLVKSYPQFNFIYQCLAEHFYLSDTETKVQDFRSHLNRKISHMISSSFVTLQAEFHALEKYSCPCYKSSESINQSMGRFRSPECDIIRHVSYSFSSVHSKSKVQATSMDENASHNCSIQSGTDIDEHTAIVADSYKYKGIFHITEMYSNMDNDSLWQTICDNKIGEIVLVSDEMDSKEIFWPNVGESKICGECQVTNTSVRQDQEHVIVNQVKVSTIEDSTTSKDIELYQFVGWPEKDIVPALGSVIDFLQNLMTSHSHAHEQSPILLIFEDVQAQSGLFCVLWRILETINHCQAINIFQAVRFYRNVLQQKVIPSFEQYKFLYKAVEEVLKRNQDVSKDIGPYLKCEDLY